MLVLGVVGVFDHRADVQIADLELVGGFQVQGEVEHVGLTFFEGEAGRNIDMHAVEGLVAADEADRVCSSKTFSYPSPIPKRVPFKLRT